MNELVESSRLVLEHHARSFRWGAWFLPESMHDDAALAYAFCRAVDDAVDEAPSTPAAREAIDRLESELRGEADRDALVAGYVELCERTGVGLQPALDLIAGARSDLGMVRVENGDELKRYCYRVAGTVGLMMCGILNVRSPEAKKHAVALGVAMQLTNICRDVLEDAARGRVYLPRNRLRAAGAESEELMLAPAGEVPPRVRNAVQQVVADLLDEADEAYRSGAKGYRFLPRRPRLAVMVAAALYRGIGTRLRRRRGCDALQGRTHVSAASKIALTVRALLDWIRHLPVRSRRIVSASIPLPSSRQIQ